MDTKIDTTCPPPLATPSRYDAMSVWNLYTIMTTMVAVKQLFNLTCCAAPTGDDPVFEWADEQEGKLDEELQAMANNLMARKNLTLDEQDYREMAMKRVDGFVLAVDLSEVSK